MPLWTGPIQSERLVAQGWGLGEQVGSRGSSGNTVWGVTVLLCERLMVTRICLHRRLAG